MSSANSLRTDSGVSTGGKLTPVNIAEGPAVRNRHFRIDTGHPLPAAKPPELEPAISTENLAPSPQTHSGDEPNQQQTWLQLHAIELIDKLQSWSADLDSREAQLNARTALLEHRERQLRLEQQSARLDLDDLKASFQQEVAEMRAAARRLAFE